MGVEEVDVDIVAMAATQEDLVLMDAAKTEDMDSNLWIGIIFMLQLKMEWNVKSTRSSSCCC